MKIRLDYPYRIFDVVWMEDELIIGRIKDKSFLKMIKSLPKPKRAMVYAELKKEFER